MQPPSKPHALPYDCVPCLYSWQALTNVVLPLRLVQCNVLADEHADANARQVEAVQELVDVWEVVQPYAA